MKHLFFKYFNANITEEEERTLINWIESNPENQKEFLQEKKIWDLTVLHSLDQVEDQKFTRPTPLFKKYIIEALKIAAIVLVTILVIPQFIKKPTSVVQVWNTLEVPIGQRTSLTLSDGTVIWLNAKSRLRFPNIFTGGQRVIELDGEAAFRVKHDKNQPFIVKTKHFNIKDLGTEFNVYAYDNSEIFETTLVNGKVQLENKQTSQQFNMEPDQKAIFNNITRKINFKKVNAQESMSWIDGIYSFNNQPLYAIIQRLERYYEVNIGVKDPKILTNKFTGKFRYSDPIEVILEVIKKSNSFRYQKKGNTITIY